MNKIEEIKQQISELELKLINIQNECSHPVSCVTKKYKSDTGNWCRDDDSHWLELSCSLCGKDWRVYSSNKNDDYRQASIKYTNEVK